MDTKLGGKAASSHNHAAGDISSGTLSTARGGTGNSSVDTTPTSGSTKMVTSGGIYNALSGKANSSHNHGAGNITSGTLALARGGTGGGDGGWKSLTNNTVFSGTVYYRQIGFFCEVLAWQVQLNADLNVDGNRTLLSSALPGASKASAFNSSSFGGIYNLAVSTSGSLTIYNTGTEKLLKDSANINFMSIYLTGSA